MALITQYSLSAIEPFIRRDLAQTLPCILPAGGPLNVGGRFAKGTVLGCVGGTPTNEVWTLAIAGATGTVTFTFTADKVYQTTFAVGASLVTVKTQLETIFGSGNLTVTGTPGTSYTITFGSLLANRLMGGLVGITATAGTPTLTRATPGSAGAGQFGVYDNSTVTVARSILMWDYLSDPAGGIATEAGSTFQPTNALMYSSGYFAVADLTGLDSAAVSDPGFRLVIGSAITETGAVIGIGV